VTPIRLAIIDSQECIRQGFAKLLADESSIEIVSVTKTGEEAVKQCRERQPDVVLLCRGLSECGGMKSIYYIHEMLPKSRVMVTSEDVTNDDLMSAITAGVGAYLSPDISTSNLISAIKLVAEGGLIMSPHISEEIVATIKSLYGHEGKVTLGEITVLTKREKAVLDLVEQGLTNKEIATAMSISEHTVKVHMQNIMEKLHAHTRQQAVSVFTQRSILHGTLLY